MVSLGDQTAFFFIRFRSLAISHSVSRIHGACSLPGLASGGGGSSKDSALLVEIPATALCTLVPITPGGLGPRGILGSLILGLGSFGGLGGFTSAGLSDRFRNGAPTRVVVMGIGDGGNDSQSDTVLGGGESGFGGGRTSPGTVTFRPRFLARDTELGGLAATAAAAAARAPSRRSVIRGGGVVPAPVLTLPPLDRFACGEAG